jgi:hypothetical protein
MPVLETEKVQKYTLRLSVRAWLYRPYIRPGALRLGISHSVTAAALVRLPRRLYQTIEIDAYGLNCDVSPSSYSSRLTTAVTPRPESWWDGGSKYNDMPSSSRRGLSSLYA